MQVADQVVLQLLLVELAHMEYLLLLCLFYSNVLLESVIGESHQTKLVVGDRKCNAVPPVLLHLNIRAQGAINLAEEVFLVHRMCETVLLIISASLLREVDPTLHTFEQ